VEMRAIAKLQAAIDKAILDRDALKVDPAKEKAAADALTKAQAALSADEKALKDKQAALKSLGGRVEVDQDNLNSLANQISQKQSELTKARNTYDAKQVAYGALYDTLTDNAKYTLMRPAIEKEVDKERYASTGKTYAEYRTHLEDSIEALDPSDLANADAILNLNNELDALETAYAVRVNSLADSSTWQDKLTRVYVPALALQYSTSSIPEQVKMYNAYSELQAAQQAVATIVTELTRLQNQYNDANKGGNAATYDALTAEIEAAEDKVEASKEVVATCEAAIKKLEEDKLAYKTAGETVLGLQEDMDDAVFNLEQQKKNDETAAKLSDFRFAQQEKQLSAQRKLVKELESGAEEMTVTAEQAGRISNIHVIAGGNTTGGQPMCTINLIDRGYILKLPVTLDQAKKVQVGDVAQVSSWWWGGEIVLVLQQIQPDPSNPSGSRLLVFSVSGDVEVGTNLNVTMGQRSRSYDTVVPKSALKSDANGDFVLVVRSKNTPLGNRYTATRVDVKILAQDDSQAAVSGLGYGDYVITTSSKPLENGTMVRLVDEAQ